MDLQDLILKQPRGIIAQLARKTGLCELTVIRCVHRVYCGPRAAKKIAAAFGKPKRWPELVRSKGEEEALRNTD